MYTYTKIQVLQNLRIKIIQRENRKDIASWAYERFLEQVKDIDPNLEAFLIDLSCMQEQEISYDELEDYLDNFYMGDDFVYDRLEFVKELRRLVKNQASIEQIASWALNLHMYKSLYDKDTMLHDLVYTLALMCCSECFPRSYEELDSIANRVLAGEDVKLLTL